jgi:hypothetical protein
MKHVFAGLALVVMGLLAVYLPVPGQTAASPAPTRIALSQMLTRTSPTNVTGEVPAPGTGAGTWTLKVAPATAECYRNGLRQMPGADYTIAGNTITSQFWETSDTLLCDYSY